MSGNSKWMYITNNPSSASKWVYITNDPSKGERVHITNNPNNAEEWVYITNNPSNGDWIYVTNPDNLPSDVDTPPVRGNNASGCGCTLLLIILGSFFLYGVWIFGDIFLSQGNQITPTQAIASKQAIATYENRYNVNDININARIGTCVDTGSPNDCAWGDTQYLIISVENNSAEAIRVLPQEVYVDGSHNKSVDVYGWDNDSIEPGQTNISNTVVSDDSTSKVTKICFWIDPDSRNYGNTIRFDLCVNVSK